jgi:hypothetical protein
MFVETLSLTDDRIMTLDNLFTDRRIAAGHNFLTITVTNKYT